MRVCVYIQAVEYVFGEVVLFRHTEKSRWLKVAVSLSFHSLLGKTFLAVCALVHTHTHTTYTHSNIKIDRD